MIFHKKNNQMPMPMPDKIEPIKRNKVELDLSEMNLFSNKSLSRSPIKMRFMDPHGNEFNVSKE